MPQETDVVVVGAGLGGIVAAARCAQLGHRVLLIEAGDDVGGTAMYSGGGVHIWGATSWDEYRAHCPMGDAELARILFENFSPFVKWLLSTGAPGRYRSTTLRGLTNTKYQLGRSIAPHHRLEWFHFMADYIKRRGGTVQTRARVVRLLKRDENVEGLTYLYNKELHEVKARSVILATGGFQANEDLLRRYINPVTKLFVRRAVEFDIGDGLSLAREAGAVETSSMNTLYGHLMPAPPCNIDWSDYLNPTLLSAFYAQYGIVVNDKGHRFVDEGPGELDGTTINSSSQQKGSSLWIILDSTQRRLHASYELPRELMHPSNLRYFRLARYFGLRRTGRHIAITIDSLRYAVDRGAICLVDKTIAGLTQQLATFRVDAAELLQTISNFNYHVSCGSPNKLPVPRTGIVAPLVDGPFFAIKVGVGVSMTYGGIKINGHAQVMDERGQSIPGLLAVPGAAGGVHQLHYAGALAACGVYGFIAAEHIGANSYETLIPPG